MSKPADTGLHPLSAQSIRAILCVFGATALPCAQLAAQQEPVAGAARTLEEIIVVGSQIKGANIIEALAVTVVGIEDIEVMGIDSGDELLQLIPENGQNLFNEAENITGGVNAARGDVGAFNLRNLGTGNTLVLLNGRRLVNSATYQTEVVGGSFIPVNTVNSQIIPVWGVERIEVLRDGASAIYGADAVAGVVNTVLQADFEGFDIRVKWKEFANLPRDDQTLTMKWGRNINHGRTNVAAFFNYYTRDRVSSRDDARWASSDLRSWVPAGSPWEGDNRFRNSSVNSLYGQFDVVEPLRNSHSLRQNDVTDGRGEFEIYPLGDERCDYPINETVCGHEDGQDTVRFDFNAYGRDIASDLKRAQLFFHINHSFENGLDSFTELLAYRSETNLVRHPSYSFTSSELVLAADSYYNPFGPCGSPNRLPDDIIGGDVPCTGLAMTLDNYRYAELPRVIDNDGATYRVLQGLRGVAGDWDWESALSWSRAGKDDITHNRISNSLMQEALNDITAAAYNPFVAGAGSNLERALVDVYRKSETELVTFDVKLSKKEIFQLPAGPVGFAGGVEWREESFDDDRDPRLDGSINFTDAEGDTFPYVSDVVNSSPTPDNNGSRRVSSVFAELQAPLLRNLDLQLALRHEDFSDIGETATVGKAAFGWRPFRQLLIRGSWSEAFRAPNLVTVNEDIVARTNTRDDYACIYADDVTNGAYNLACRSSIQRAAEGSDLLQPEESENTSIGFAWTPNDILTLTLDYWSIEKEKTIGLFGEENHTLLDLYYRIENGLSNCDAAAFNTAVERTAPDDDQILAFGEAGICPAGDVRIINDVYRNLDTRSMRGHDIGLYLDLDSKQGRFRFSYNGAFLDEYEQEAGGLSAILVAAQSSGAIPVNYPVAGFADLVGFDGNQEEKHTARLSWRKAQFGASLSGSRLGKFYQGSLTLEGGERYVIPTMETFHATLDYTARISGSDTRIRLGVNNFTNQRAPLADRYFGYFSNAHTDYGRYLYLDIRSSF